jgi:carbon starvation protein
MGKRAKKLFIIFALLVLILVIASFVNVVAGTFFTAEGAKMGFVTNPTNNQTTALISVLFIILAVIYGILTNKCGVKTLPATIIGIAGIVVSIIVGLKFGLAMTRTTWIILIGVYIAVASLIPVWIMLQPRDYLSSFLLYGMMAVAIVGIVISAFTGSAKFTVPAFNNAKLGSMFPTLFITVACGACSGFHSLISTGTSSKQLDNEKNAKAIGYGSMLIESALGIIALIAVGMIFDKYTAKELGTSPANYFAAGIATMFSNVDTSSVYKTIYALLTLAVSVFALTSLDTGTRLSRFMFSELFLKDDEATWKDAKGIRKLLAHPLFGTTIMVVIGCVLGGLSLSQIWGLFGAANQLLAGIALMAVATWLGEVGKNNKMFYIPMIFMLAATLTFLAQKIIALVKVIAGMVPDKTAMWGDYFQLVFAAAMFVLAIILIVEGVQTFAKQAKAKKA